MDQHNKALDQAIGQSKERVAQEVREKGDGAQSEILMVRTEVVVFRGTKAECLTTRWKWADMVTKTLPGKFQAELKSKGHISIGEKTPRGEVVQHYTIANVDPKPKGDENAGDSGSGQADGGGAEHDSQERPVANGGNGDQQDGLRGADGGVPAGDGETEKGDDQC